MYLVPFITDIAGDLSALLLVLHVGEGSSRDRSRDLELNESLLFHCRRKAQLFSNLPLYNIPTPKLLVCPAQHFTTRPFEAIGPITPCDIWLRWLLGEGAGLPFAKRIRKVLLFARNKLKAGLAPFFPNGFFFWGLPHTIRKTASLLTWRGLGKYTQPPPCSSLHGRCKANGVFVILTNSPSPSPTTSRGGVEHNTTWAG